MFTCFLPLILGLNLGDKDEKQEKEQPGHQLRALKIVTKDLAPVLSLLLPVLLLVHLCQYQVSVYLIIRVNMNIH